MPQRGFMVRNRHDCRIRIRDAGAVHGAAGCRSDGAGRYTRYTFTLKWTPDPAQSAGYGAAPRPPEAPNLPTPDPDAPPDLFTAIQQQLGLQKMKTSRVPVDVMVIDKVQKPTEN